MEDAMSNTSETTPYETDVQTDRSSYASGTDRAGIASLGATATAVAAWLQEDAIDREVRERLGKERVREALRGPTVSRVRLHQKNVESVVCSAERLGYQVERVIAPIAGERAATFLLKGASGQRLAIEGGTERSGVTMRTAGGEGRIREVVRQHTLDRTTSFLASRGFDTRVEALANGEARVTATARGNSAGKGATVTSVVRKDGDSLVDVGGLQGPGCEELVKTMADSTGARVVSARRKGAFFQLPGEPARVKVRT